MKTLGTKLDNNICQEFIDICNSNGQTVSEKIREMIQTELEFLKNCENEGCDQEMIELYKTIFKNMPKCDEFSGDEHDNGKLKEAKFTWFSDEEKKEFGNGQKVHVKFDSNKPESEQKSTKIAQGEVVPEFKPTIVTN